MIDIAICDDNIADLMEEEKFIKTALENKNILFKIDLFKSAKELIEQSKNYSIVFLDVEMEELNGIDAASKIHEENSDCFVFFVTNYEGYMDDALNECAFRFWTKPLNNERRLVYGIECAMKAIQDKKLFLPVTINKRPMPILMKNVILVFTENRMTYIVTVDGKFTLKENFKQVKGQLNRNYFCESHASYSVNFNYVSDYTYTDVTCKYKDAVYTVPMSKRKYSDFKKGFINWAGGQI